MYTNLSERVRAPKNPTHPLGDTTFAWKADEDHPDHVVGRFDFRAMFKDRVHPRVVPSKRGTFGEFKAVAASLPTTPCEGRWFDTTFVVDEHQPAA